MSQSATRPTSRPIVYPSSDGKPMAENTLQFQWIVTIKENLEVVFIDRADIFVAGDLLWYPVQGEPKICQAPDTLVAFGRPKGYRPCYKQWEEGGLAPKVVFEVLSPGNRVSELTRKFKFYERFQVEEYYVYDPDEDVLSGWIRKGEELVEIPDMRNWVSPLMGIRFDTSTFPMTIYRPDGTPFLTFTELAIASKNAELNLSRAEKNLLLAEYERNQAEQAKASAEQAKASAEQAKAEAEQKLRQAEFERDELREQLKRLGGSPNA